jgi:copper homeostasis protein
MNGPVVLEICADSIESAIAAERGGAHRIELCSNLLEGGVTPSFGLISAVRNRIAIDLYVMIRPRGGDFCYTADEFAAMQQDVLTAKQLGASGFVLGILRENGTVDASRTRTLIDIARPLKITFHRAFDMCNDLSQALEEVIAIGADRILTSGGEQTAEAGLATIAALVKRAGNRIAIMAGAGIKAANVLNILAWTGVGEIHATARVPIHSRMQYRNDRISMGAINGHEYERIVATEKKVSELLAAIGTRCTS